MALLPISVVSSYPRTLQSLCSTLSTPRNPTVGAISARSRSKIQILKTEYSSTLQPCSNLGFPQHLPPWLPIPCNHSAFFNISLSKADKDNSIVILDKEDYKPKLEELLEHGQYLKIKKSIVQMQKQFPRYFKKCESSSRKWKIFSWSRQPSFTKDLWPLKDDTQG